MRSFNNRIAMLALLMGSVFDHLTRSEQRTHARQTRSRGRKRPTPVKGCPEYRQIVYAVTRYGQTRKCIYTHKRFFPLDAPYSFSWYEIMAWGNTPDSPDHVLFGRGL